MTINRAVTDRAKRKIPGNSTAALIKEVITPTAGYSWFKIRKENPQPLVISFPALRRMLALIKNK